MLHLGALVHPREPFPHLLCFSIHISDFNYNSGTWNSQMAFVGLARPNLVLDFTRNRKRSNDHSQRGGWDGLQMHQWPHNSTAIWTELSPRPAEDHSVLTAGFQGVFMVWYSLLRRGPRPPPTIDTQEVKNKITTRIFHPVTGFEGSDVYFLWTVFSISPLLL